MMAPTRRSITYMPLVWTMTTPRASSGWVSIRTVGSWNLVVLRFDSGNELLIHAMKARSQYFDLL